MSDRIVYAVSAAVIVEWELVAAQVRQTGLAGSTTVRVFDEANTAFSTPSITELSLGGSARAIYQASFTPDAVGQWHVTIDETTGPFAISESYEVVAAADVDSARLVSIQADTDNLQTRIPAALVSGRMDSSVGAMANDVVTAAAIATDAIGSAELAASAVTEIQTGLATSAALTTAQADLDDIQTRLPAALVGGRMDSSVGAMAADVITAAAIATDAIGSAELAASAITEIQAGLATSASIVTLQADTDDIQARLPATLSGGRMRSQVEGMDAGTVTASAIATGAIDADALAADAGTEIGAAVDVTLTAAHGAGAWGGGSAPTVAQIVDGVLDEILAGHLDAGSVGEAISDAAAGGAGLTPQQARDSMMLAPSPGAPAVGSIDQILAEIEGPGFDPATDSLEEIRDEVDACCGTSVPVDIADVVGI